MKTVSYYPGCSLHGTAREYDLSTKLICNALGVKLEELKDWCCCGATSGHSIAHDISITLPCWNIALAESKGQDVVIPCAACFNRLKTGEKVLKEDAEKRSILEKTIGFKYKGNFKIYHLLDYIVNIVTLGMVKEKVTSSLNNLKVACYYGCLINRPNRVTECDNPEQPMELDELMEAIGCYPVRWSYKNECCGGSLSLVRSGIVNDMVDRLVFTAKRAKAELIVTACPLCQANLEMRQTFGFPVLYFTEVLGIAFGIKEIHECLEKHDVMYHGQATTWAR